MIVEAIRDNCQTQMFSCQPVPSVEKDIFIEYVGNLFQYRNLWISVQNPEVLGSQWDV